MQTGAGSRGGTVGRTVAAWAFAVAMIAVAVALARTDGGIRLFLGVQELVARPSGALGAIGDSLPPAYAFAAGMLAAVNPCGIALLPGYLGLYLGEAEAAASPAGRLRRALAVAVTVSGAFVLTFGAAGLLLATIGAALGPALPLVGLAVGLGLAAAGGYMLSGGTVRSSIGDRTAARLARRAGAPGYRGYAAYGVAYAAASLGCALPVFLTVVGLAATTPGAARGLGEFAAYGLGMGLVVTALTVVTALFKSAVVTAVRVAGARLLPAVGGALLVITGAYVIAYWLALGF